MLTKDDLQAIGEIIDQRIKPLHQGQARLEQGQAQTNERLSKLEDGQVRLEDGQTHLKTAVEALKAGQDDIRDKMATEAVVMDLGAKVDRITRNHERRIEELEERAGLPNPTKN